LRYYQDNMIRVLIIALLVFAFLTVPSRAQDSANQEFKFESKHRVNAHGNEFNGLAKSADGKRLFIATEKGEIIVWDIASQRAERTLRQPSADHLVASLGESNEILAVSSNHFSPGNALVRKWNVETGTFVDLPGVDESSFLSALATDSKTGLAAVGALNGSVFVWNLATNKQLASWKLDQAPFALALIGRGVYAATVDPKAAQSAYGIGENAILKLNLDDPNQPPGEFLRVPKWSWTTLTASPDQRLLSATVQNGTQEKTVIIDPNSKAELGNFGASASLWLDASKLVLFDWLDPSEIVQVPQRGRATSIRRLPRMKADTDGRAFQLTGQVANAAGTKLWASYEKGPGLLEFDLTNNKIKTLIQGPSGAYAISVSDPESDAGQILTGGADGYVRLWKLSDLSLVKEFRVAAAGYYVTDAKLLAGGRKAIVAVSRIPKRTDSIRDPIAVLLLDLETGQQTKLFDVLYWRARIDVVNDRIVYPEGSLVKLTAIGNTQDMREVKLSSFVSVTALSANHHWLAAVEEGNLTVVDLQTLQKKIIAAQAGDYGAFTVTNDGRYVYQIANGGELTKWDMDTGQVSQSVLSRVREMHSDVDFMMLANADEWLITAGNHGDIGIFDRTSGRLLLYTQTSSRVWYVEKVWVRGQRMIFTTDTGVMMDGNLVVNKN
jgi:WD40 repeat protein